jgi:hypothetical protein
MGLGVGTWDLAALPGCEINNMNQNKRLEKSWI